MITQAARILKKFKKRKVTQTMLADELGVGQSAIANMKTRGFIESRHHQKILEAAKKYKVKLLKSDFCADNSPDPALKKMPSQQLPSVSKGLKASCAKSSKGLKKTNEVAA